MGRDGADVFDSEVGQYLTTHGVTEVVVTGIRTEQYCETSAWLANDLGYQVQFVLDATATMPLERWCAGTLTLNEAVAQVDEALLLAI